MTRRSLLKNSNRCVFVSCMCVFVSCMIEEIQGDDEKISFEAFQQVCVCIVYV
jgi:hypothetical protein